MVKGPTLTLGICLAAGLAAGIALARPATLPTGSSAGQAATAQTADQSAAETDQGYGSPAPQVPAEADGQLAQPSGEQPSASQSGAIEISGFAFGNPITVAAGSSISVTNSDGAPHTVTSTEGGLFDTGSIAGGGATTFTAPTEPGTYNFFCSIHPSMQGTLTVGA